MNRVELMGLASEVVQNNMFEVERYDLLPTLTDAMPQAICNSKLSTFKFLSVDHRYVNKYARTAHDNYMIGLD